MPVVMLVLYLDPGEWDTAKSLSQLYSGCNPRLFAMAPDYEMNLVVPLSSAAPPPVHTPGSPGRGRQSCGSCE